MLQSGQSHFAAGSSQRNRNRKQSLPQRSCLDPAMSTNTAKTTATSAAPPRVNSKTHPTPSRPTIIPAAHATGTNPALLPQAPSVTKSRIATSTDPATATSTDSGSKDSTGHDATVSAPKASKPRVQAAEPRQRHPKHGMCSFCHETDSPLWRKGPEEYPHLCNRCGMRYFRYKKSDPPKDPFTQRIYDDIVDKRKVRSQPAVAAVEATAAPSLVPNAQATPSLPASKRHRKAATASGSGFAQMLQDMRGQHTERSTAGQEVAIVTGQEVEEDNMGAGSGSEDGSSEQPNPKKPRTTNSLPNSPTTIHSVAGKVTGSMVAASAELATAAPAAAAAAASTPAAAAIAQSAHAQLLKFLQGPEIQAYLQRIGQTVNANSAAQQGAAHQALAAAPMLMGGLYHMNSLDSADTAQLPQL